VAEKAKVNLEAISELEKSKDEILRRIAEKVKANANTGMAKEFGAAHNSHSSSSKHSSSTS
jgi:hypothetical protein